MATQGNGGYLAQRDAERVMQATAAVMKVPLGWIKSRRRDQHTAFVRQVGCYLCRELTKASYPVIAHAVNRDHSTAIHGHNCIAQRVAHDMVHGMAHEIQMIRREVEAYLEAHSGRESGVSEGASRPDGAVPHFF